MIDILGPWPSAFAAWFCALERSGHASRACVRQERRKNFMRRSNFGLRVPPSLLAEARKAADSEWVALNQLITLALAEKCPCCARRNTLRNMRGEPIPQRSRRFALALA